LSCGSFLFSSSVANDANGIAYKVVRDWEGCRLAIANVSSRAREVKIGVSLVGQAAPLPPSDIQDTRSLL
jgi:hypothetical protein